MKITKIIWNNNQEQKKKLGGINKIPLLLIMHVSSCTLNDRIQLR